MGLHFWLSFPFLLPIWNDYFKAVRGGGFDLCGFLSSSWHSWSRLSTTTSISKTGKRRHRRRRAAARALWHRHRTGLVHLSRLRLAKIAAILSNPGIAPSARESWPRRRATPGNARAGASMEKGTYIALFARVIGPMAPRHSNTPKSPRSQQSSAQTSAWNWNTGTRRPSKRGRPQHPQDRGERQKGEPKGQSKGAYKGHEQQQVSPFATQATAIPPWPNQETSLASAQNPFPPSAHSVHWMLHWFRFTAEFTMIVFGLPAHLQARTSWSSTVLSHFDFCGHDTDFAICIM